MEQDLDISLVGGSRTVGGNKVGKVGKELKDFVGKRPGTGRGGETNAPALTPGG